MTVTTTRTKRPKATHSKSPTPPDAPNARSTPAKSSNESRPSGSPASPVKTRTRRTLYERIAEAEAQLKWLRERETAKAAMRSPQVSVAVRAFRLLLRATTIAASEGDPELHTALERGMEKLRAIFEARGIPLPRVAGRRRRKVDLVGGRTTAVPAEGDGRAEPDDEQADVGDGEIDE